MSSTDRRRSLRYNTPRDLACLGWWERGQFQTTRVQIRNLSTGGAMVSVDQARPVAEKAWICLVGQDVTQWVGAQVTGVTVDESGNHLVRLAFPECCPYDVFRLAVWGDPVVAADIALLDPPACFAAEDPSTPPSKTQQAWFAGTQTHPTRTDSLTLDQPSEPQQVFRPSPEPDRSNFVERSRFHTLLPWVTAFVINTILVFWLGILAAQRFHSISAFWTR
jgi:hypothetical protein